ncbi:MAG: response regulator [Candidatus Anammoxibacter sp.]
MSNKILFVDDDEKILSSLKRLFMEDDYEIFTASSGLEAIEALKKESVDVIVSDQKMPKMTGVEFLQRSKEFSPDSIRILLTGYMEVDTVVDSINKGEVYRYIMKPWNNDEIKSLIKNAIELKGLSTENERLVDLTQKQNIELKDLNANLEEKLREQEKLNKALQTNEDALESAKHLLVLSNI